MANWQRSLNLLPEWATVDEPGGITRQQMAKIIAERLRELAPFLARKDVTEQRNTLADTFEGFSGDETLATEEFNFAMQELYEWGDISLDGNWNGMKVCWVRTF